MKLHRLLYCLITTCLLSLASCKEELDMTVLQKTLYEGVDFDEILVDESWEVTVKTPMERSVVRFYDSHGRLVLAKPFDFSTTVTTQSWAPGVYVWEIWHDTGREASGKWIKR